MTSAWFSLGYEDRLGEVKNEVKGKEKIVGEDSRIGRKCGHRSVRSVPFSLEEAEIPTRRTTVLGGQVANNNVHHSLRYLDFF